MKWYSSCLSRLTPIGIDVGGSSIKAAQLFRTREGYDLAAAAVLPLAMPDLEIDLPTSMRVRYLLQEEGFRGRAAVLAVPNQRLQTSLLDLPAGTRAPVQTLINAELHRLRDMPTGSFEMAHWKLPTAAQADAGGASIMAVAALSADLEPMMDVFEDAGFHVRAIDAQSWALLRACREVIARPGKARHVGEGLTAIVDLGYNAALVVVTHDGRVLHQNTVASAGARALRLAVQERFELADEPAEQLVKDVALELHGIGAESVHSAWTRNMLLRHADVLATQIKRTVDQVIHRYPPLRLVRVILTGGGAQTRGLAGFLAARFGAEVVVARPPELVRCSGAAPSDGPSEAWTTPALACAIGLARWGE